MAKIIFFPKGLIIKLDCYMYQFSPAYVSPCLSKIKIPQYNVVMSGLRLENVVVFSRESNQRLLLILIANRANRASRVL